MLRRPGPVVVGVLAGAVALLTGCRTTVTVDIDAREDGGGEVTVTAELDAEAAAALGGPERIEVADLEETGWSVEGPREGSQGGVVVSASHPWSDAAELGTLLSDLGGDALVTSVDGGVTDGFGRTTHELEVAVSTTGDPADLSDDDLTAVLGGLPLGRTPEELAFLGATAPGAATLVVSIDLPGGGSATDQLDLTSGGATEVEVVATSTVSQPVVLALTAAAVGLAVLAVVLAVVGLVRRLRT